MHRIKYNMRMNMDNTRLNILLINRKYQNNARARERNTYDSEEKRKYANYLNAVKRMQKAIAVGETPKGEVRRAERDGYIEQVGDEWFIVKDIREIFPRDIIKSMEVIVWR